MKLNILKHFGLIYLGSPYTIYPLGLDKAFEDVAVVAARLVDEKIDLYSPIVHCHPLAQKCKKISPIDHDFWMGFHAPFMRNSGALVVAKMLDWKNSRGLKEEIEIFTEAQKFVFYLDLPSYNLSLVP